MKEFFVGESLKVVADSWDGDRHRHSYGTIYNPGGENHHGDPEVKEGEIVIFVEHLFNFYGNWARVRSSSGVWDIPPQNLEKISNEEKDRMKKEKQIELKKNEKRLDKFRCAALSSSLIVNKGKVMSYIVSEAENAAQQMLRIARGG